MSPTWITFGTIARAHGVRGELRIRPLDPAVELPAGLTKVRACSDAEERVLEVRKIRPIHRAVLLTVEGVADRDAAQALAGSRLEIDADELPPPEAGCVYTYEIEGAAVVDESGIELGVARRLVGTRGHDLLEIDTPQGERLLPWVDELIVEFDRDARRVTVRVPQGLWD
ncbi:MAG: ribosome maturation factor RimM [Myxococcota bacterium]